MSIAAAIKKELEKQEKQDFQGFTLKYDDAGFSAYSQNNDEWQFIVPMEYNGNRVLYIPKSYLERGYAWTNPATGEVQWYATPILLNSELQTFLRPAKLDEGLINSFKVAYSPDRNYGYNDKMELVKVRDVTSHMLNVPNFDEGFIIDHATFNGFQHTILNGRNNQAQSDVYRWSNPLLVPTGMGVKDGQTVYMAYNQWKKGYQYFYIGENVTGLQQWYEAPRSYLGKFFDSIGLEGIGDLVEGPILSTILMFVPGMQGIGLALAAGNAIRNENWGQLALTLVAANIPGSDGATIAANTMFEIPAIANATANVATTLGVSASTASLIVKGTIEFMANGFDLEAALKSTAANYVSQNIGDKVGKLVKDAGFQSIAKITQEVTKASTRAMLLNQPVDVAAKDAFVRTSIPMVLNSAPGGDKLSAHQKMVLNNALTTAALNPNANIQDILKGAVTDVVTYKVINEAPSLKDLPEDIKKIAYDSVRGLVQGQNIDSVLQQAMIRAANAAVEQQVKDYTARQEGWKDNAQKEAAIKVFGPQYGTKITADMYKTLMDDIKTTTFNADTDDKIATVNEARDAAIFGGYNNFIFDKKIYTIGGQSFDAADTLYRTIGDEFVFDGRKARNSNEAILQAYKAGFNTVWLPNKNLTAPYTITQSDQQNIQRALDFPGVFDGSRYKDINAAANAAAAVDENKFLFNGAVYVIKAPESVTNQIKSAKTFNEAFALAQEKLGQGNVFEWNGKLYVNRTKEQQDAMPFNGNKYEDRGAAAYAAHMAGKTNFMWGGNVWELPKDYASQISRALGQNPNQSAAETKRLLDANIRAASSSAVSAEKFRLDQTGIPVLDKVIGAIAYNQGLGIEGVGSVLTNLSKAQALSTGGRFDNTLKNVGSVLETFGQRLQPEELAIEGKRQADIIAKEVERAGKTDNPFEQTAIVAKAILNNPFGYWTSVGKEIGEEAPGLLLGATALIFAPLTASIAGGATLLGVISAGLNGAEVFGSSGKEEYDRLIAKGETDKDARTGGIIMGAVNAAITMPLEYFGDKALALPYLEGIKDSAQTALKSVVNPFTVNAATEYIEELFQGVASRFVRGEPQNIAEDSARAIYAAAISAGTTAGILAPSMIGWRTPVGRRDPDDPINPNGPILFRDLLKNPSEYKDFGFNPKNLDLNTELVILKDGSSLTLAGLQLLLPNVGINQSFISKIAPELALSRDSVVAFTAQPFRYSDGTLADWSTSQPLKYRDSQYFWERNLINVGEIPKISEIDARKLLQSQGRNEPTQAEIDQVINKARDEKDTDIAKQVSDPYIVSLEEVKEAARAAGYAISDDEAKKYVGERLESEAIPLLQQQFDPLGTTEEEVRQIFAERGYTPTQQEIERFVGSTPEAQIQSQVKTYVDPRMLYPEDIKNLAAQEGYQISDARARELSGQKDKYASLDALRSEFDAGAVTLDEARAMFAQTPYKPTDAEIQQFIGSKSESQIQQDIANYVDPRYVTAQEIKDAAAQEGYQITDEQALALVGQKSQQEALAQFRAEIDPQAVNEAEVRAFFREQGYQPTNEELQQFIASRSEAQVMADITAYVDPRYITLAEVKQVANEEGYAITDDEAFALTGQKSQKEVLDQLRAKADAASVLQSEADQFFREFGYTPTQEELQQFIGSKPESQIREDIRAYVDPRFVTLEEVKAAARAEGYDLTDQEAAAIVGQRDQAEAISQFRRTINPKAVTESEAREFFKQLGYEPTPEELRMFTASRSEEQVQADLAAYVNPRYVTMAEVKAVAASEGYDISDEEALALTGQKSEKEVLDALRAKADTSAVLQSEAEEFFKQYGYTPTAEELDQFTGSRAEDLVRSEIESYVDPRYVTLEEVKDAARAEGYDITDEEAAALVGQKSQAEAIAQFREQIDPKAVIDAEAQAFFAEFGYVPNNEELSLFIQSRSEDEVRADIQTYIDPRQVTREEAEAKFRELQSEYGFTPEEIDQFIRSGPDIVQGDVLGEIGAYIDPRYVTQEEVKSAYTQLGLTDPLAQDVSRFTGQADQNTLQERLQEYLPTAQLNVTNQKLADLQAENERQQEIKRLNDQFVLDITALIDQNIDIKTAIDQTLGKIDDPTKKQLIDIGSPSIQMLAQQQATKKAAQQQQKQQLVQQGLQMMGGQTPADTQVMSEPFKPDVQSLYSGDPGDEFISPLAPFLQKVEEGSYTGEPQPQTAEQPLAEPKDLTDMKRREQGYFTYGQPSEIDQNIAAASDPFGYYSGMAMSGGMKEGGMVAPLMAEGGGTRYGRYAGGGLNLVPHTGKMRVDFREGDAVTGAGDGQSDDIPAMLADGEFVIPADVVAALGNGSTKAGSDKLYDMMHSIRSHVRSADPKKLPPPVKSPLDYISKRPKAKRR